MTIRSRRSRTRLTCVLALVLLIGFAPTVQADPGDLDPTFSGDGKVITEVGTGYSQGMAVAIQPDGKIVVAGYASNGANNDFALVRYLPNGSLDLTFDGDGKVMTDFGAGADTAYGLALQTDGKIIAAGTVWNGSNRDFGLVRYNADGSLDTTFDGDGKVMTAIGSADDRGYDLALQANGKILVVGRTDSGTDDDFAVVRYNANGSLDNTCSGDGKVVTAVSGADDWSWAVEVQPDQKIVVAGATGVGSNPDVALARYEADGTLDASFGTNGIAVSSLSSGVNDGADDIVLQPDRKIVVAGTISFPAQGNGIAVARYNPDGSLDLAFDADGKVESLFMESAGGVALQANGRIVVAGGRREYGGSTGVDFAFMRFNPDGSGAGSYTTPIASGSDADMGYDVAIQPDGKIVIAGLGYRDAYAFAVARYLGEPPPPMKKVFLPLILR